MDKDRIKGKVEDIGGQVQQQAGEWTDDEKTQAEGLKHQVKGKARNLAGKMKDAGREAMQETRRRDVRESEDIDEL